MNKFITTTVVILTVSACGLVENLENGLQNRLQAGQLVSTGRELSQDLGEIKRMAGGIHAFVPKLDEGQGNVNLAPRLRLSPRLSSHQDGACTETFDYKVVEDSITSYPPEAEESSAEVSLYMSCVIDESPVVAWMEAEIKYKDGSTGTTSVYEVDNVANNDVPDFNLVTDFVLLKVARYFGQNDERVSFRFVAEVDLQGGWEENDNLWRYGWYEVVLRNGAEVTAEIQPDEPIRNGEDMTTGTASRTMVHAAGKVTQTTEVAVITGVETGTFSKTVYYRDGKSDAIEVSSDGVNVTVHAEGRDGYVRDGSLNLQTGEYEVITEFPDGHLIDVVTESGTWRKNASGNYKRVIDFSDGRQALTEADVIVVGNSLEASFSHEYDTKNDTSSDSIEGEIYILDKPSVKEVSINITNGDGDSAKIESREFPDGSAKVKYSKDRIATADNPDEEGVFTFEADGSAGGEITVSADGTKTVYTVTINADGSGEVRDESGDLVGTF